MRSFFVAIAQSFKTALFPSKCHVCRAFFKAYGSYSEQREWTFPDEKVDLRRRFAQLLAPYLCPACINDFIAIESPMCPRCGIMFASRTGGDHLCGECLGGGSAFLRVRSAGVYTGTLLALIHQMKYHGRSELSRPLGKLLFCTYTSHWESGEIDWIMPVPLHPRKLRRRGFNQSQLLMAEWPKYLSGKNREYRVAIGYDTLRRVRWTAPQTGLGRRERKENIKDAFSLDDKSRIRGCSILLIDDVFTTGATARECTRVLKRGGVKRVDILTLARST